MLVSYPQCESDLQSAYVKDQLIRGFYNELLQTNIFAKARDLTSLEDIAKHTTNSTFKIRPKM